VTVRLDEIAAHAAVGGNEEARHDFGRIVHLRPRLHRHDRGGKLARTRRVERDQPRAREINGREMGQT
jgi:hypothetical protein